MKGSQLACMLSWLVHLKVVAHSLQEFRLFGGLNNQFSAAYATWKTQKACKDLHIVRYNFVVQMMNGVTTRIHPLIYTPVPNSMWLHNTPVRYARNVQLGAFMWLDGLNWVKIGSKWAQLSRLRTPNGP